MMITQAGTVLVVDDVKTNQDVAIHILDKLGCQAKAVANGKKAIAELDAGYRYIDGTFWAPEGSPYSVEDLWG